MSRCVAGLLATAAVLSATGGAPAQTAAARDPTGLAAFLTLRMSEGGVEAQRTFKYDCDTDMGLCIEALARLRPDRIAGTGPCPQATAAGYARARLNCLWIAYDGGLIAEIAHTVEATREGWTGDVSYVDLTRTAPAGR